MSKKALVIGLGVVVVAAGALALFSGTASAAEGPLKEPKDDRPPYEVTNAAEAYSLAMNPTNRDPELVHKMALLLQSTYNRPDLAAGAERRSTDLRAEQLLGEALKNTTTSARVEEIANILKPTHPEYTTVLVGRLEVERGMKPPAPFALQLRSGGSLNIDLSIFSPAGAGASPVGPSPGGSSPAIPQAATTHVTPATAPPTAPPTVMPSASPKPPGVTVMPPVPAAAPTTVQQQAPPAGTPLPALALEETKPENDPNGTIRLARLLLAEQNTPGWKYISQPVKEWQAKVGLTADGKFGPGAALKMAEEVFQMPWIRYFNLGVGDGSQKASVEQYRGRLKALALSMYAKRPDHAAGLMIAADHETGQGWPKAPTAAPTKPLTPEEIEAVRKAIKAQAGSGAKVSGLWDLVAMTRNIQNARRKVRHS